MMGFRISQPLRHQNEPPARPSAEQIRRLLHYLRPYLRPMGEKVPSIYGPSADDPGGA